MTATRFWALSASAMVICSGIAGLLGHTDRAIYDALIAVVFALLSDANHTDRERDT